MLERAASPLRVLVVLLAIGALLLGVIAMHSMTGYTDAHAHASAGSGQPAAEHHDHRPGTRK